MDGYYQATSFHARNSLGYLLRRASKLASAHSETVFEGLEISFTQWVVLALVDQQTATTSSELSRDLGHNSGAMSRLIDQLAERGLLERMPDSEDRRCVRLAVTAAGGALVTDLAARVMELWNGLLRDFDEADISRLILLLDRLVRRLEESEAEAGN